MNNGTNHQAIEVQAYYRWIERGRPLWDDWRDWFEAQALVHGDWKPGWPEMIDVIAYHHWDQEGRPEGRDLEFWTAAERVVGGPK